MINKNNIITFGVSVASNQFKDIRPEAENDRLYQAVVECHGVANDGWIIVKSQYSDNAFYEIAPDRFIPTPTPQYLAGEVVYVQRKSSEAIVLGLNWHFKRNEYIYTLIFNKKRSSRRFFDFELENLTN